MLRGFSNMLEKHSGPTPIQEYGWERSMRRR
jgi:hypothetical protein